MDDEWEAVRLMKFTLVKEVIDQSTTYYGFGFITFEDAKEEAFDWAVEDWGEGNFHEVSNGYCLNSNEMILIEAI